MIRNFRLSRGERLLLDKNPKGVWSSRSYSQNVEVNTQILLTQKNAKFIWGMNWVEMLIPIPWACLLISFTNFTGWNEHRKVSQHGLVVSSKILRYFPCSGSLVWFRNSKILRTFGRRDYKFSGPRAVANSHAAG